MTSAEYYALEAKHYQHGAELLADDYPAGAAYEADMADWCQRMAAGYRANGDGWLPF